MLSFFDAFWGGLPLPQGAEPEPQPLTVAPYPATPAHLRLPDLPTPDDEGLSDPVYLTRMVERRMRAQGLLDDERPARHRLHRAANDRWRTPRPRQCA